MSAEFDFTITGNDTVDTLQALQRTADEEIRDQDLKIQFLRSIIRKFRTEDLLEKQFLVSSIGVVLAKSPDQPPDMRHLFANEMTFLGQLNAFSYLVDENIPLDSLVLNFDKPELFGAREESGAAFRTLSLQVPILAIESCVYFEAA